MKNLKIILIASLTLGLFACDTSNQAEKFNTDKIGDNIYDYQQYRSMAAYTTAQSSETNGTVTNSDGSFTFTQIVDKDSKPPFYTKPTNGGGFSVYGDKDQDFGWTHIFDLYNKVGMSITSATLTIYAFDIDSDPNLQDQSKEFDQASIDGKVLNPGFLQGKDDELSETSFDIPLSAIIDDGKINVFLDIDIKKLGWRTDVRKSILKINYVYVPGNLPPYKPELEASNNGNAYLGTPLKVKVIGPNPADPNEGDTVSYSYRWFVDIGQGEYIDTKFAGLGEFSGAEIPASVLKVGQKWRVQVLPRDQHKFIGDYALIDWKPVTQNLPPIANAGDDVEVEQVSQEGTQVSLSASKSYDPESDPITYLWTWAGGSSDQRDFSAIFPAGETKVTLTITETETGRQSTDSLIVRVKDTIAPTFSIQRTHYWNLFDDRFRRVAIVTAEDNISKPIIEVKAKQTLLDTGAVIPVPAKIENGNLYIQFTKGFYIRRIFTLNLSVKDTAGNITEKEFIFKTWP